MFYLTSYLEHAQTKKNYALYLRIKSTSFCSSETNGELQFLSKWVKMLVPQWEIEPQCQALQASVTTARPPRHCYIDPSKEKVCPDAFLTHFQPGVHFGDQMSQLVKNLVPQQGIEPQSLAIQVSIITTTPPRHCYILFQ